MFRTPLRSFLIVVSDKRFGFVFFNKDEQVDLKFEIDWKDNTTLYQDVRAYPEKPGS